MLDFRLTAACHAVFSLASLGGLSPGPILDLQVIEDYEVCFHRFSVMGPTNMRQEEIFEFLSKVHESPASWLSNLHQNLGLAHCLDAEKLAS